MNLTRFWIGLALLVLVASGITWGVVRNHQTKADNLIVTPGVAITTQTSRQPYAAKVVQKSSDPFLVPGEATAFEVKLQNTGTATWSRDSVHLGTDKDQDRAPRFIREDRIRGNPPGWFSGNRVLLVENKVAPGETGTFRFWYTLQSATPVGVYKEAFRPVAEGIGWFTDPSVEWTIMVQPRYVGYHAAWISQNANPTLRPGKSYQFEVKLRNSGRAVWEQNTVRLGSDRPQDRNSTFIEADRQNNNPAGWVSTNRIQQTDTYVRPGDIGTFRFYLSVPGDMKPGTYREYFRPVAENITWMEDMGIYWEITVTK